jgi:hypothetical protein
MFFQEAQGGKRLSISSGASRVAFEGTAVLSRVPREEVLPEPARVSQLYRYVSRERERPGDIAGPLSCCLPQNWNLRAN